MSQSAPAFPFRRGLAFLSGLGFAALPAIGPFLALLALASGRIELQRSDRWWWAAALLVALPAVATGFVLDGALDLLQVLAVWLIFRCAAMLRASVRSATAAVDVGAGLVVGLALALAVGFSQLGTLRPETALTLLDSVTWQVHPVLFAHSMVVLAALLGIVVPDTRLRALALALGALAVLVTGAREAALAWLVIAIGFRFVSRRGDGRTRAIEWSVIALMLLLATGLGSLVGVGRPGFLIAAAPGERSPNLFRATEAPGGDWWDPLQVRYSTQSVLIGGETRMGFVLTKTGPDPWARLQQIVTLQPSEVYTLSAAIRAERSQRPGLDGWGRPAGSAPAVLASTGTDGTLSAAGVGGIEVLATSADELGDGWTRYATTFRFTGEAPLSWYSGVVVDRAARTGAQLTFAELQLAPGDALLAYVPGEVDRGAFDMRTSRFPIWRDAIGAIQARPWLGWGPGGLPRAVTAERPDDARLRPVAAHAHNQVLATWVDRGLVGLLGVALLFALLALRAVQQRDGAALVVILGVVVLGLFDATLLSGGVIYPLAAVLGWRAVGSRAYATSETGVGSALGVRLTLAVADVASPALAVMLASALTGSSGAELLRVWTPALGYALLAWPLAAGLSGLYPGYGLPLREELARTVRAAATAGAVFVIAALTLGDAFALPRAALVVAVVAAVALAPLARWLAKWVLRQALLWGRPVVMIGTGPTTALVARYLLRHPGIGLRPVAVFGEGPLEPGGGTLPSVLGRSDAVWPYLSANGIRHVIVSPEASPEIGYDEILRRADQRVRYVQFLPNLHGLPASSVVAAPVGITLGLEVRNQLASNTNRAVKRILDVLGASALLALLAPALLVIAAWIRLDSRGPVFYLSPRLGRHGQHFRCVKFRTMHVDADDRLHGLLAADPAARAQYQHFHKLEDDPRVTRAGALLRRLSLDEFPQLFNVLAGHMSLVGPRPYMVRELDQLGSERDLIFLARPGMTGYWQVDGRNDVSFAERQAMEADYVRNWSVWWDIELLLRTPAVVLLRTGK